MTRIAFAADLHVDSYGGRVDPETGLNARLVDYLTTLRWVANESREREAEALVVAGDFTERRHPAPWLVTKIRASLAIGPVQQLYLRGNHDGEIDGASIVTLLADVVGDKQAFSRPGFQMVDQVAIACIPYLDRHWLRTQTGFEAVPDADVFRVLADQFLSIARGLYVKARNFGAEAVVLVCHQTLAGGQMSDTQQAFLGDLSLVVDARALQAIGFEAVVAGHLHRHQVVVPGDRPVLYAGSIERVDFGEESETKGFIVANVGPGVFEWEFVPTPARRFVTLRGDEVMRWTPEAVAGAVVRCLDIPVGADLSMLRQLLVDEGGAFDVGELRMVPVDAPAIAGGLSETLTAEQALEEYFAGDIDRDALLERGRQLLAGVR